jgi:uncharacterized coiled-coil protein SlyX
MVAFHPVPHTLGREVDSGADPRAAGVPQRGRAFDDVRRQFDVEVRREAHPTSLAIAGVERALPGARRRRAREYARPMEPIEARVIDLELRFMRVERELAELSRIVAEQQRTIDALVLEARRRREREAMAAEPAIADEPPPHY